MAKRKPLLEDIREATETITKIIDERRDEPRISPSWVATEALAKLGVAWMLRHKRGFPSVYRLAHLQCRQIARALLRQFFEPDDDASKAAHPLFPDLQWRYPVAPSPERDQPVYIKLELLNSDDWDFNIHRLRSDAMSRLHHADALFAWGKDRFRRRA